MTLTEKIRNIALATMLSAHIVSAPVSDVPRKVHPPDIYGTRITKMYRQVPEDKLYEMIDLSMEWLDIPEYMDRYYARSRTFVESTDNAMAKSNAGARGLLQNTPIAWNEVSKKSFHKLAYNPQASITVGFKYSKWIDDMLSKYHPRWQYLSDKEKRDQNSAAYNGGIGRLMKSKWDISKMPQETKDYVRKINRMYYRLSAASDG